jgi:glutathione S-transferase
MKLYDNPTSPYAFKVRAVLYEKGIDVEHHEILRESQRGELLAVSPRGEVPALVDGDAIVYDSTLICEYLEERHPSPPLLPADSAGRARVRALERWADMQLDGASSSSPSRSCSDPRSASSTRMRCAARARRWTRSTGRSTPASVPGTGCSVTSPAPTWPSHRTSPRRRSWATASRPGTPASRNGRSA